MLLQLTNVASALLATSIGTSDTSFAVASGSGSKFPALTAGQWFPIVLIDSAGNIETMRATARAGDVITVTRGQEGTAARSFTAGARVELRITALAITSELQRNEAASSGLASHAVTGGTLDLSATAFDEGIHKFTGPLTSDLTVIVPNKSKRFLAINATTGAYFMVMKTTSGSAICIPQDTEKNVTCDGADVLYRSDRQEVGKVEAFAGASAPSGTFLCDGSVKARLLTPDLYGKIGTIYGSPSGATFTLPDYVTGNRFLRAAGGSIPVGTYQDNTVGPHNHTGSATFSGSVSTITPAGTCSVTETPHQHHVSGAVVGASSTLIITGNGTTPVSVPTSLVTSPGTDSVSTNLTVSFSGSGVTPTVSGSVSVTVANNSGTTETRPNAGAVLYCIRY
jgi:microcystin-dependent protein